MGRVLQDLTEAEHTAIINDYLGGRTLKEMIVKYDLINDYPIRRILDNNNVPTMKSIREDMEQDAIRLYQAGVLMKDILANTGFKTKAKVYEVLKRHGIPTDRPKGYRGKAHAIYINTPDWEYILSVSRGSDNK